MAESIQIRWHRWLDHMNIEPEEWHQQEMEDRLADLRELRFLLNGVKGRLNQFREAYPDDRFEQELSEVYERQLSRIERTLSKYEKDIQTCDLVAFLELKYAIRKSYKQIGSLLAASDWPSPCISLGDSVSGEAAESGYGQLEEGTYQRSYGSERVKQHERAVQKAFFPVPPGSQHNVLCFAASSGMKALELALAVSKSSSGSLPQYYQAGFYGEGVELAKVLLGNPVEMHPDEIYRRIESNERIGGLMVDPGACWPVHLPIDLERLMRGLHRHQQDDSLYVIVDRTFTTITNPLFENYLDKLPEHVVLIIVESGIKYLQYGLELSNVGYVAAAGQRIGRPEERERWIEHLAILDAGADPMAICQLPEPDLHYYSLRLDRLNRNAYWVRSFLDYLCEEGLILSYYSAITPSPQFKIMGKPWAGSVFYIRLKEGKVSETECLEWINELVASAPDQEHFVSGGSFGFDSFRLNAVNDDQGMGTALRLSVGREPFQQLMAKLRFLHQYLIKVPPN
ncbi:hypothetical protein [Paenibacillus senegalensis]|uniref:hypothetical protein n=1 Tax=Paenibacillus senegalensis TaxID=1465766 RepID=UPI000288D3C1|nr:hypothetical protein [Paenibacillus senegalensis]